MSSGGQSPPVRDAIRSCLGLTSRAASFVALASVAVAAAPASALTLEVKHDGPSVVGQAHAFKATATGANGAVTYEWKFADADDFRAGGAGATHTFTAPGFHNIDVIATDAAGGVASAFFQHLVHHPLTARRPTSSTSIVHDSARNRVYVVNQDNDTVTSIDADKLQKIAELAVYRRPESLALTPEGKLWIVHRDDYAVAVVDPDRFVVEDGFRLPYASQPVGVAMSPSGDAAYVSLMAVGKLLKLDPRTGAIMGEVMVGARPRGIAVSHDGKDVYVTRFISPDAGGEVIKVDAGAMRVATRIVLELDSKTVDSDLRARGLPNYLFSVALTPDGRQAWIPGKKDNVVRGKLRDGRDLTHDTTVRPLAAIIDTLAAREIYADRVDLDNRSQPVHVTFSPLGNFAILTLAGSNRVEIRDVNRPTQVFSAIPDAGTFPRAAVLAPDGRLFVQGALSRNVLVYDLSGMLKDFAQSTPAMVGAIPTVASEKVSAEVLAGKKIFHDAEDTRMAFEGYLSCGACHFEGDDDGRIWDFSTRGEGLRNTVTLLGRAGTRQGRLNWAGTFDEVQDFEHQIRDLFQGRGFLPDDTFHAGMRDQPLGDPKAGLSRELDALAAYVASLDHVNPSPQRNPDGSLTADGVAGKALFEKLGCDFCHGGPDFTDSARGVLRDVGTITPLSGARAGGPLLGIDTPTLLGVWETAPYLHDGSAPTLRDVLTTNNPTDLHGYVSALSSQQIDQLIAYLMQIDDELPVRRLPFDAPFVDGGIAGDGGPPLVGGSAGAGCGCQVPAAGGGSASGWTLLGLVSAAVVRRRRRAARARAGVFLVVVALLLTGCGSDGEGDSKQPTDWSKLPTVTAPDPELAPFGTREGAYERICARGRGDSFAKALCGGGQRPEIRDMAELLELVGLGDRQASARRAFALTGNSTSLVAMSVSAINPRILVFPRVGADLKRPDTMTAVGFVRGERFVEVVSRDPSSGDLNFYLLSFEQPCSYVGGGCDLASVLTEEIEHDWTAYSVYDQDDLEGTSFDCRSCHQPAGVGTKGMLRMQELAGPWMHWFPQRFVQRTDTDRALVAQFAEAHQVDKQYGGIPIGVITNAVDEGSGAQLEAFVRAEGFGEQPNPFDAQIATEMKNGTSPTWQARFDAHLRGEAIAVPYPRIDVSDATKRVAAARAYQDVARGVAPRSSVRDLREVFTDDAMEKVSFVPQPGADGKAVLLQMCARCHDGRGDPQLNKNRFNVRALDQMPRAEKDLAISRITDTSNTRMPPWRVGTLTSASVQVAVLELQK
jgi:MYXO-CTERM domain-containing protein